MATAAVVPPPAHSAHPPTTTGLDHRKVAIWAFIGSECMLFASLISTYLIYKGRSVVGPFPHEACNPPLCATPHDTTAEQKIEQSERVRSAEELGIPLPYPTIKPLFVALFMTLMFASLLFIHKDKTQIAIVGILLNAAAMTAFLYAWLTAPLEPEHVHH